MKFDFVAILIGTASDLFLSLLAALALQLLGVSEGSPFLFPVSFCLGLVAVAIGGYVTARLSKWSKLFNATTFALTQLVIAIAAAELLPAPLWFDVASITLIIPTSFFGAYAHFIYDSRSDEE